MVPCVTRLANVSCLNCCFLIASNRNAFAGVHFIHFPVLRVACELQLNPSTGLCNQQSFVGSNSSQEAWSKVAALKAPLRLCTMFWVFSISVLVLASGEALRGEAVPDAVLNLSCDHCELRERLANLTAWCAKSSVKPCNQCNQCSECDQCDQHNEIGIALSTALMLVLILVLGKSGSSCVCTIATYQEMPKHAVVSEWSFALSAAQLEVLALEHVQEDLAAAAHGQHQSASVDVSPYGCWMQWPGDCNSQGRAIN